MEDEDEGLSLRGRWVNSHDLFAGDLVQTADGRQLRVLRITQRYEESFEVCNLTIDTHHSFAVGLDGILVHNTSTGCGYFGTAAPKGPTQDALDRAAKKTLPPRSADEIAASRAQWLAKYGPKPNQMNQQIYRGAAPRTITRVDTPKIPGEQLHVHLEGGHA